LTDIYTRVLATGIGAYAQDVKIVPYMKVGLNLKKQCDVTQAKQRTIQTINEQLKADVCFK